MRLLRSKKFTSLFLPLAILIVIAGFLFPKNLAELAVAREHDGTDRFLEQVRQSSGEWIENAGIPIFDNQTVATLPPRLTQDMIQLQASLEYGER